MISTKKRITHYYLNHNFIPNGKLKKLIEINAKITRIDRKPYFEIKKVDLDIELNTPNNNEVMLTFKMVADNNTFLLSKDDYYDNVITRYKYIK